MPVNYSGLISWRCLAGIGVMIVASIVFCGFIFALPNVFYSRLADGWTRLLYQLIILLTFISVLPLLARLWQKRIPGAVIKLTLGGPLAFYFVAAVAAAGLLLAARFILLASPNSADEWVYLFQADTYLMGDLWVNLHPLHEFFSFYYLIENGGKWVGQYPPGWSLVLALGAGLSLPAWSINPLLGTCALALLYRLARATSAPVWAITAVLITCLSGYFIFNMASFFNHGLVMVTALVFSLAGAQYLDKPRVSMALVIGMSLGLMGLTRHYSVLLFGIPFVICLITRNSVRHYLVILWAIVPSALCLALLAAYNSAITGDPLLPVARWAFPNFGLELNLGSFDIARIFSLNTFRAIELGEWVSPVVLPAYLLAMVYKYRQGSLQFYDWFFLTFIIGMLLYSGSGGNRYGPRYYFQAYPFLVLTITTAAADVHRSLATSNWRHMVPCAIVLHLLIAVINVVHVGVFLRQLVAERVDLYQRVEAVGLTKAIVLVRSSTGFTANMPIGDLIRNSPALDDDVLYAWHPLAMPRADRSSLAWQPIPGSRDLSAEQHVAVLRAHFPDRAIWVYERQDNSPLGTLRALAATTAPQQR